MRKEPFTSTALREFMGSEFFFAAGYRENYSDPINGAMEYNMVRKEPFASTALRSPILESGVYGVRVFFRSGLSRKLL